MALGWVGACAFPDYTFQDPSLGSGGLGATGITGDVSTTGSGAISSTGSPNTDAGSGETTTNTTTSGGGGSGAGGDGGGNLAGSAGEGVDGGSDAGGSGATRGPGGMTTIGGAGGASGTGGVTGTGGVAGTGGNGGSGQCGNDDQCLSGQCDDGWCRPEHCGNGAADELETDIDCGGPYCRPCGYDEECMVDGDCATLDCSTTKRCAPTLVVNCHCNSAGTCNQTPQDTVVDIQLWNEGSAPVAFDSLKFRYFYSAEGSGSDEVSCDTVNFTNGNCSIFAGEAFATEYDNPMASHEVEFSFSLGTLLPGRNTGSIRFSIHDNGPYQRGNDYSFQGAPTGLGEMPAACENIVVMNADDVAIWGVLPE